MLGDIASVMNRWGSQGRIDHFVHINDLYLGFQEFRITRRENSIHDVSRICRDVSVPNSDTIDVSIDKGLSNEEILGVPNTPQHTISINYALEQLVFSMVLGGVINTGISEWKRAVSEEIGSLTSKARLLIQLSAIPTFDPLRFLACKEEDKKQ
ncbi:hypothetical protein L208DRAFT_1377234 [Tricholoma matsutake]|nr:hypothetical protein L208DRAFT_1377234 [Tricholoma matsutake 945]